MKSPTSVICYAASGICFLVAAMGTLPVVFISVAASFVAVAVVFSQEKPATRPEEPQGSRPRA